LPHLPHLGWGTGGASRALHLPHHHPSRGVGVWRGRKTGKSEVRQMSVEMTEFHPAAARTGGEA
jgi:hypothetical protein